MANPNAAAQANPAALGLVCFGLTTVLLSLISAGVLPVGGEPVVIPLAIAFGGTAQILAGLMEFKLGNTFGTTAFIAYGAFWWWFALLLLFGHTGVIDLSKAGPTVPVALILWGVFTLYMWIGTFRLSPLLFLVFLTLWVTFFLLGGGGLLARPDISKIGGWVGLACGTLAMYGSFAMVINSTAGKKVMPLV